MSACCEPMSGSGAPSGLRPPRPNQQPYYVDTTNGSLYWWNGTGWLKVAPDNLGVDYEIATRRVRLDNGAFTTLPIASGTDFGLVRVGNGLTVGLNGVLSTNPIATVVALKLAGGQLQVTVNGATAAISLSALAVDIFGAVACQDLRAALTRCSVTPPVGTPPVGTPPVGTPPVGTPPVGTPPVGG